MHRAAVQPYGRHGGPGGREQTEPDRLKSIATDSYHGEFLWSWCLFPSCDIRSSNGVCVR